MDPEWKTLMAKKNKKQKMFSNEAVKAAYKLGYDVGKCDSEKQINAHFEILQSRLIERIERVQKANHYLMKEVLRLDKTEPVTGIVITYTLAKRIIKALKESRGPKSRHARLLTTLIKKENRKWGKIFKDAEEELSNAGKI